MEPRARAAKNRGQQNFTDQELQMLLYAHGDVPNSLPGTIRVLDEMLSDFIIELCFEADRPAQLAGRQKVKLEDFKFACRKDPLKLGKIEEVFERKAEIDAARKAVDVSDDKITKTGVENMVGEELGEADDDADTHQIVGGKRGKYKKKEPKEPKETWMEGLSAHVGDIIAKLDGEGNTATISYFCPTANLGDQIFVAKATLGGDSSLLTTEQFCIDVENAFSGQPFFQHPGNRGRLREQGIAGHPFPYFGSTRHLVSVGLQFSHHHCPLVNMAKVSSSEVPTFENCTQIATIILGEEKKEWKIPTDLLCFHSDYFRSALKGGFAETKAKRVELLDQKPAAFELVVEWLYTHVVGARLPYESYDEQDTRLGKLLDTWLLAEYLQMPRLRNIIIRSMSDQVTEKDYVPVTEFNRVCEITGYRQDMRNRACQKPAEGLRGRRKKCFTTPTHHRPNISRSDGFFSQPP
ncbi:hypothetical protein V496_03765 [Pseudogymnoascus sp. VKM F-4515 (FW-2607)]|nr:hypothetical protein V496_03765 [Pseudogymnoascus sp. VKM F-4515 (FW-2607)]